MFENLGPMELMVILLLVLVFFGAKRLPEVGASLGKGIREFKRSIAEVSAQVNDDLEPPRRPLPPPRESVVHDATAHDATAHDAAADEEREPKRLLV